MLKIRVMNITKNDSARRSRSSRARRGIRARSSRRSTRPNTGSSAASRTAAWSATTTSTRRPPDVELLGEMAQVSAAAHTPFIAGAVADGHADGIVAGAGESARSDQDLQTPEYAAWRSLRESEDSRYLGLAMPRFLSRLPYGAKTEPGRGIRVRRGHRRRGSQQVHLGQLGLRDGGQHQPLVQALRLVLADSRRRIGRRGRRPAGCTRSRPTTAAST